MNVQKTLLSSSDLADECELPLLRTLRRLLGVRMGGGYVGWVSGSTDRIILEIPSYLARRKRYHVQGLLRSFRRTLAREGYTFYRASKTRTIKVIREPHETTIGGIRVTLDCRVVVDEDGGTNYFVWTRPHAR